MKKIVSTVSVIAFLFILVIGGVIVKPNVVETDSIYLANVGFDNENTFSFEGGLSDSMLKYAGYNYEQDGENVYIQIKSRIFSSKDGSFEINIKDQQFVKVKNVYLIGKDKSDAYLIYPLKSE